MIRLGLVDVLGEGMITNFFEGKVAIVTGASSGIGEQTARALSKRGAKVVLSARRKEILENLERELPNSFAIPTDIRQVTSVEHLVQKTLEKFSRIDILVNNAGILLHKPMVDSSREEIVQVMQTNFFGQVLCACAVMGIMRKQKFGSIVNVASIAGRIGFPNIGYYSASKFALVGFSETLRQELRQENIFVSTICPGIIDTPMNRQILEAARAKGRWIKTTSAETVAEKILWAIEKRKREVFVPFPTHLLYLLHFFFPSFTEWLAWKFRASEPGTFNQSKERQKNLFANTNTI